MRSCDPSRIADPKSFYYDRRRDYEEEGDGCDDGVSANEDMVLWDTLESISHA